jgi:hypothetical protein
MNLQVRGERKFGWLQHFDLLLRIALRLLMGKLAHLPMQQRRRGTQDLSGETLLQDAYRIWRPY